MNYSPAKISENGIPGHYVSHLSSQLRWYGKIVLFLMATISQILSAEAGTKKLIKIVAFGDSLTAGYQLPPGMSFPTKLEKALIAKGYSVKITNAGVSGDTTTGGLARLDWAVPQGTDIVILELGANDALRGIKPDETRKNLDTTIQKIKAKEILTLFVGMKAPRNMGQKYVEEFDTIYPQLAKKHSISLYPFFLKDVALRPELNLSDGIHPNTKGIDVIVRNILPYVEKLIAEIKR